MHRLLTIIGLAGAVAWGEPASAQSEGPVQIFDVGQDVYVRSLAVDGDRNSLWVGTSVGAMEIDLATTEVRNVFTRDHGLANEYIFAIGIAPGGEVWFGTNAGGASVYRDGGWRTYFPMHGLADYWIYAFAFDRSSKVWIGTWDGASHFDPDSGIFTNYRDELINIWVYGLDIDPDGRVWFGTEGGVSMLDGETWRSWTHEDGLGAANIGGLPASDNTGLGTRDRHDLNVLVGSGESYNPNYVFSAKVDALGRGVWFGTWGGGISLFDGAERWTSYSSADGLAGNIVYAIAQDDQGTIWTGTNHGLSKFDGQAWSVVGDGVAATDIYAVAIDDAGAVWLGTKGAVIRFTPDRKGE